MSLTNNIEAARWKEIQAGCPGFIWGSDQNPEVCDTFLIEAQHTVAAVDYLRAQGLEIVATDQNRTQDGRICFYVTEAEANSK